MKYLPSLTPRTWVWITFNLSGLLLFYRLAIKLGPKVEGQDSLGDGLYFVAVLAPVLLVFFLVNALALLHIVRTRHRQLAQRLLTWMLVAAAWLALIGMF